MVQEKEVRKGDDSCGKGSISIVGAGPGDLRDLTSRAQEAIASSDVIVGYTRYVELISSLIGGKEVYANGMTHEIERCGRAIAFAKEGKKVAVISSGDSGIYGMAGLVFQLAGADEGAKGIRIEVIPGVPAFVAAAGLLGAPLMHDFASISLSDLLTDWDLIAKRVEAAAKADFVIALYNPKSSKRVEGLAKAIELVRRHREATTPVGIVRNATREGEEVTLTRLGSVEEHFGTVDMLTLLIIGNSATFASGGRMITPRGYKGI